MLAEAEAEVLILHQVVAVALLVVVVQVVEDQVVPITVMVPTAQQIVEVVEDPPALTNQVPLRLLPVTEVLVL
jgi:hypothetical protein